MKFKIMVSAALTAALLSGIFTSGCGLTGEGGQMIGVSMPSTTLQRWNQDGENIARQLMAKGYQVDLKNADDDVALQVSQIEGMIGENCKVLVIAAIDSQALKGALAEAADRGIKVIAYDRLIMDSPNVDYYATFNNFDVGVMQGRYIESALGLKNGGGPYNMEIFSGSPNDNNSKFFYNGAMSVLSPYIESEALIVRSGQTDADSTAIMNWVDTAAELRMRELLTQYYGGGERLDAVLSPNDGLAMGVIRALRAAGYGEGKPFPIITGQDCDKDNVIAMLKGEQSMSVFKDTRALANKTAEMIDDIIVRKSAGVNDTSTYDNGVKVVPTFICTPVYADKDNYRRILIDTGYYTDADLAQ